MAFPGVLRWERNAVYDHDRKEIRPLPHERPHGGWTVLILAAALVAWLVVWNRVHAVRTAWWADGTLRVVSMRGGGVVVTHLAYGDPRGGDPQQRGPAGENVAALPRPRYGRGEYEPAFTAEDLRALEWRDRDGRRGAPPTPGDAVRAVFFRPGYSLPARPPGGAARRGRPMRPMRPMRS